MSVSVIEPPHAIILSHQRSGTHLLQAALASHPRVHGRGEFILQYRRRGREPRSANSSDIYVNRPGLVNLGIVMYSECDIFQNVCARLDTMKIIHLLRNPRDVARSVAQMEADRVKLGPDFKAHYTLDEVPHAPAVSSEELRVAIQAKVAAEQEHFMAQMDGHPRLFVVTYEDLTGGKQTNALARTLAEPILNFIGLEYRPLTCNLRKSAPSHG